MASQTWVIDNSHSGIHFSVRHLVIAKVRGQFSRWTGTVEAPDGDFSRGSVRVEIDPSSIETGVAGRDEHLRSGDFFDVAAYPEMTFTSTRVEGKGANYTLVGTLTIKGVSKEVALKVESHGIANDPWGNIRAGFTAKTLIDRRDFGLTWNQVLEAGGVAVGDRIEIEIDVEAVKQAAAKVA